MIIKQINNKILRLKKAKERVKAKIYSYLITLKLILSSLSIIKIKIIDQITITIKKAYFRRKTL